MIFAIQAGSMSPGVPSENHKHRGKKPTIVVAETNKTTMAKNMNDPSHIMPGGI